MRSAFLGRAWSFPLFLAAAISLVLGLSALSIPAYAADEDGSSLDLVTIQYDEDTDDDPDKGPFGGGIHYVMEKDSSGNQEKVVLYCMNNGLHWPHDTARLTVPSYTRMSIGSFAEANGISDVDSFSSAIKALLYSGYPYNGLNSYTVTDIAGEISEKDFNRLLIPSEELRSDFPESIGNTQFSYSDFSNTGNGHVEQLKAFIEAVVKLSGTTDTTPSGLTASDIQSMPFYTAAYCLANAAVSGYDPLAFYSSFNTTSRYVTELQAYNSTARAMWNLMSQYRVEPNQTASSDELSEFLLAEADGTKVLTEEPTEGSVYITGDASFTLEPDGLWHSGELTLNAPANYAVPFDIELPDNTTTADGSETLFAGQTFSLVSSEQPKDGMTVTASASVPWMDGDLRVYHPVDDDTFQNMVGAVIRTSEVSASATLSANTGSLKVSKKLEGVTDDSLKFDFTITLVDGEGETVPIDETYGDVTFANGIAAISLADGESLTISGLPSGLHYKVEEAETQNFKASAQNDTGVIPSPNDDGLEQAIEAAFTNTYTAPVGSLRIKKVATGTATPADTSFTIYGPDSATEVAHTVYYKDFIGGEYEVNNLPVGTYIVVEDADSAQVDGYTLAVGGDNGTAKPVAADSEQTFEITNAYTEDSENPSSSSSSDDEAGSSSSSDDEAGSDSSSSSDDEGGASDSSGSHKASSESASSGSASNAGSSGLAKTNDTNNIMAIVALLVILAAVVIIAAVARRKSSKAKTEVNKKIAHGKHVNR